MVHEGSVVEVVVVVVVDVVVVVGVSQTLLALQTWPLGQPPQSSVSPLVM